MRNIVIQINADNVDDDFALSLVQQIIAENRERHGGYHVLSTVILKTGTTVFVDARYDNEKDIFTINELPHKEITHESN